MSKAVNYFIVCESVINGEDGRVSMINAFNSMNSTFPIHIKRLTVALSLDIKNLLKLLGGKKEAKLQMLFKDPKDKLLRTFSLFIAKENLDAKKFHYINADLDVGELDGIMINKPGTYTFELSFNGSHIASRKVTFMPTEEEVK